MTVTAGLVLSGCGNESGSAGSPTTPMPSAPTLPTASVTQSTPVGAGLPLTVSRTGGFAGFDDCEAALAQQARKRLQLRRLADPLAAFEADESPAPAHAIPSSDFSPIHARVKKPASPTSSPATSGTTCGSVSPVVTTSCATSSPFLIGALIGPL